MDTMPDTEQRAQEGLPDGYAFRMELVSNNGDAMEKMGRVDPGKKGFLRRLFDLLF